MFQPSHIAATIPAQDYDRAKAFYAEKLGLTSTEETGAGATYRLGETEFLLFSSSGKASGDHTQLGFFVSDVESAVASLRDKGVVFEEYDFPDFTTVNGIGEVEGQKGAWFKDSEGNLISLGEFS